MYKVFQQLMLIEVEADSTRVLQLKYIPYYLWANRTCYHIEMVCREVNIRLKFLYFGVDIT
ncbi:hypothetical protein BLOT_002230 [Blomia tropicalis]|nr:hypothetical protein BLOT_002230 [Blomia tropicalis]